jgi:hypothetical protein
MEENDKQETVIESYEQYVAAGGALCEADYRLLQGLSGADGPRQNVKIGTPTIFQVKGMAERSGIAPSEEMFRAYGLLRERMPKDYPDSDTSAADSANRASRMSDQELFAEVLRYMGRNEDRRAFIEKNPAIFGK